MAEYTDNGQPPGGEITAPSPNLPVSPRKLRKKKPLKIDRDKVVGYFLERIDEDLNVRQDRIDRRMDRYAKYRGVVEEKFDPWAGCSNVPLNMLLSASLRMKATMENAVKSMHPVMAAKALQRRNRPKEERIDKLIDYQMFVENRGEPKLDDFVSNFVDDEASFTFTHWVKERQTIRDVRVLPGLDLATDHIPQLLSGALPTIFPKMTDATPVDKDGWTWDVDYTDDRGEPATANVAFYELEDGKLEANLTFSAVTFDGPSFEALDYEDVLYPARSANTQPPTASNPLGAEYVARFCKVSLDTIRRRMDDGTYNLLKKDDWTAIENSTSSTASGEPEEEPKQLKDDIEGTQTDFSPGSNKDRQMVEVYGRWDVDGDGLEEDVIFWILRKEKLLCKAAMLTEIYPGTPIMRPISSTSFIPSPNRIDGMGLLELLESIQDMMKASFDQHFDWGTLTNTPFGAYRASSGMKAEPIRIEPGMMIPLDDPPNDLFFPQFSQRGETFNLNTIALLNQFGERLSMLSDIQYGRVPQGKASALRTMGTTNALVGQGDVQSERLLRRLFYGLAQVYHMFHRLNRRFMPEKKEIRIVGVAEKGEETHIDVSSDDIDADVDFDFKATMINANKQMVTQALMGVSSLVVAPIALQAGIVSPEQIYNLFRDVMKSQDLDPDRYLVRPPEESMGPKILAEEALSAILAHEMPIGTPLESNPMEHLQKLLEYSKKPIFAQFDKLMKTYFEQWVQIVGAKVQAEQKKQQMMAAAQQFQQTQGQQGGGTPTTMNPDTGAGEPPQEGQLADKSLEMQ